MNDIEDALRPQGALALHQSVSNAIADRIHAGEWAVGAALPSEQIFCKHYRVSRHTLRHALGTLEEMGLILRRQGAPTRVIARQRPQRFTQNLNSPEDILRYLRNTQRINEIHEYVEVDSALESVMGAPIGSSWFHIGALRRDKSTNTIVAWTDIYVLPKFADLIHEPDQMNTIMYDQIEKKFGVSIHRAEVDIRAAGISPGLSKLLEVPRDTPSLVIIRRYYDAKGELFEVAVNHHPESRFSYSIEYRRTHV